MVSRALRRRTERVRTQVPESCPACRGWPLVWLIGLGDPEPPVACDSCGRAATSKTRVYVGLWLADV